MASMNLPFLGYGLLEAWSACMFFTQGSALPTGTASLGVSSSVAVTLATLGILLLCRKRDPVPGHKAAVAGAAVLNSAATLLVLEGHGALALAGGIASGLANAWLWVSWGDIYARLETETAERTAVASATLQAVVVALVLWMPLPAREAALALLGPAAGLMYLRASSALGSRRPAEAPDRPCSLPRRFDRRFLGRLVTGLGLPVAVLYFLLDRAMPLPGLRAGLDMALVAGLLLFMVVLHGFVRFARGFSADSIFGVVASLLVTALVLHTTGGFANITGIITFAAMLLCQYLLLLYAARLAREGFGTTMLTVSAVQLVNHGSGLAGTLASVALWASPLGAAPALVAAVPTALVALLFAASLAMRAAAAPRDPGAAPDGSPDVRRVADSGGLSPREAEVFALLVKGRSAPFIRDELSISLNTVNSHIKHIYTKLGVHSRQELIDLVNRAEERL